MSVRGEGPGWAAIEVRSEEVYVCFRQLWGEGHSQAGYGSAIVRDGRLGRISIAGVVTWLADEDATYVSVHGQDVADSGSESVRPYTGGGWCIGSYGSEVRTHRWVFWLAGGTQEHELFVRGLPGTEVLAWKIGPEAFFYTQSDFDASVARAGVSALGLPAAAHAGGELVLEAEGRVIAYADQAHNARLMSVEAPNGTSARCPCWFHGGFGKLGDPGTYRFHLDGAGAGPSSYVGGAIVDLPWKE